MLLIFTPRQRALIRAIPRKPRSIATCHMSQHPKEENVHFIMMAYTPGFTMKVKTDFSKAPSKVLLKIHWLELGDVVICDTTPMAAGMPKLIVFLNFSVIWRRDELPQLSSFQSEIRGPQSLLLLLLNGL